MSEPRAARARWWGGDSTWHLPPGGVRTDIMRQMPWLVRSLINLFFIDAEQGAKTSIMLASDPELAVLDEPDLC